jgi:hypothetical protein
MSTSMLVCFRISDPTWQVPTYSISTGKMADKSRTSLDMGDDQIGIVRSSVYNKCGTQLVGESGERVIVIEVVVS